METSATTSSTAADTPRYGRGFWVAVGLGLVMLAVVVFGEPLPGWWIARDLATGAVTLWLVSLRGRWPLAVALVATAATAWSAAAIGPALVALAFLGERRRWREFVPTGVMFVVAAQVNRFLLPGGSTWWASAALSGLAVVAAVSLGAYLGSRRDLLAALRAQVRAAEEAAASRAEQARAEERTRIAREMHDVVAHRISTVALHAGVLTMRPDLDPQQRADTAEVIRDNAQRALTELRDVLRVLRAPDAAIAEPPQPSLSDLDDLIGQRRRAGMAIDLSIDPATPIVHLPGATGRHAYRIVQEALTNAAKHAPGATATVTISGAPGTGLRLKVENTAATTTVEATAGSGLGLVGMAERVNVLGGTFSHGATPQDGYRVEVELPWPAGDERLTP